MEIKSHFNLPQQYHNQLTFIIVTAYYFKFFDFIHYHYFVSLRMIQYHTYLQIRRMVASKQLFKYYLKDNYDSSMDSVVNHLLRFFYYFSYYRMLMIQSIQLLLLYWNFEYEMMMVFLQREFFLKWNFFFNSFSLNFLLMKISIQLSALIILFISFDSKFIMNSDVFDQYLLCTF